jgi:hypothetical protein
VEDQAKRELENFLIREGLAGLTSPELIDQLANLVSIWPGNRHEYLQDLINQCDADKRREMYEAIAPKLRFKPFPLSTYEARIRSKASEMVSQGRMRVEGQSPSPIDIGGDKFEHVAEEDATHAVLTLKCMCGRIAKFLALTPVQAMIKAREAGWVRDKGTNKEVCKKCVIAQTHLTDSLHSVTN